MRPYVVVHRAILSHDWEVILIENGKLGLLQQSVGIRPLSHNDFDGTPIRQYGAIIGSNNAGNSFVFESSDSSKKDLSDKAVQAMCECGVECLVGVAGIDAGTDVILIREITFDIANVARRRETAKERECGFNLLIVAEGVKSPEGRVVTARNAPGTEFCRAIGHTLAARHSKIVAVDTRVTVLGHVQRDGIPAARDRLMASTFGLRAVDLLAEGARNRMVAWRSRAVIDVPIADAISTYYSVDTNRPAVATARGLDISFIDR